VAGPPLQAEKWYGTPERADLGSLRWKPKGKKRERSGPSEKRAKTKLKASGALGHTNKHGVRGLSEEAVVQKKKKTRPVGNRKGKKNQYCWYKTSVGKENWHNRDMRRGRKVDSTRNGS